MNHVQFEAIEKIVNNAPRPFKGNMHVSLDYENGAVHIITATCDAPIIDWRIDQKDSFIISEGDPDSEKYGKVIFECSSFEALTGYISSAFLAEFAKQFEVFYFNFGTSDKYHDTFCRVTVPRTPASKDAALNAIKAKFGNRVGFQYTADEFVKFCLYPWWKGTENVMDLEDMEP